MIFHVKAMIYIKQFLRYNQIDFEPLVFDVFI